VCSGCHAGDHRCCCGRHSRPAHSRCGAGRHCGRRGHHCCCPGRAKAHPAAHHNAAQNVVAAWARIAAVAYAQVVSTGCASPATAVRGESDLSSRLSEVSPSPTNKSPILLLVPAPGPPPSRQIGARAPPVAAAAWGPSTLTVPPPLFRVLLRQGSPPQWPPMPMFSLPPLRSSCPSPRTHAQAQCRCGLCAHGGEGQGTRCKLALRSPAPRPPPPLAPRSLALSTPVGTPSPVPSRCHCHCPWLTRPCCRPRATRHQHPSLLGRRRRSNDGRLRPDCPCLGLRQVWEATNAAVQPPRRFILVTCIEAVCAAVSPMAPHRPPALVPTMSDNTPPASLALLSGSSPPPVQPGKIYIDDAAPVGLVERSARAAIALRTARGCDDCPKARSDSWGRCYANGYGMWWTANCGPHRGSNRPAEPRSEILETSLWERTQEWRPWRVRRNRCSR
jgi:hypothetical protein